MPVKSFDIKFGLVFGACLFALGLVLQLLIGPVEWSVLHCPWNLVTLAAMVAVLLVLHFFRDRNRFIRWLSDMSCATAALLWCAAMTVLMGLLRQRGVSASAWPGFHGMTSNWSFTLMFLWLCTSVLMALFRLSFPLSFSAKKIAFLSSHLGILTMLAAGTFGSADFSSAKLQVEIGQTVWNEGVAIELKDFEFEAYDDGTPKDYRSYVAVHMPDGTVEDAVIEVNKPYSHGSLKVYQSGYDPDKGTFSILEAVRDPWLPAVLVGIMLTLLGALLRLFRITGASSQE